KKPGDTVQEQTTVTTTNGSVASATFVPITNGLTITVSPNSAANLIYAATSLSVNQSAAQQSSIQLSRGTVAATNLFGAIAGFNIPGTASIGALSVFGYDLPNTTSSTIYSIQGKASSGSFTTNSTQYAMTLKEIQI